MKRLLWLAVAVLLLPACRAARSNAAGYSSTARQPTPYVASRPPEPAPAPPRGPVYGPPPAPPQWSGSPEPPPVTSSVSREFVWAPTLGEARASARAQGKMVFIETGRDACGNCQALKRKVIPSPNVAPALGEIAVGYYDDCERDPQSESFRLLVAQLPRAMILPLVGFFTPDMRWVHGFSGHREESEFLGDIAAARTAYRRIAEAERPTPAREVAEAPVRAVAVPTSLPGQSLPDEELADVTAVTDEGAVAAAPTPAPAPPSDMVAALPATPIEVPAPAAPPAPSAPAPIEAPTPVPAAAPAATPETDVGAWARGELARAVAALGSGDVATTRTILASVREKAAGTPEGRQADKGDLAIYAVSRMTGPDAATVKAQAAKDLKNTVWADLFR